MRVSKKKQTFSSTSKYVFCLVMFTFVRFRHNKKQRRRSMFPNHLTHHKHLHSTLEYSTHSVTLLDRLTGVVFTEQNKTQNILMSQRQLKLIFSSS